MKKTKEEIEVRLAHIEEEMSGATFWNDKERAQDVIKEYQDLKDELEGVGKFDKGDAVMTLFAGAGGTDSEDFVRILLEMYTGFVEQKGWQMHTVHDNQNDHGGYRNVTVEITGKGVYGELKYESGVHRLVRISPFNSNKKRHTSFAMVEVIPKLKEVGDIDIPEDEIEVDFSKSGGPGGQNVNKRETAVRALHIPTGISVHVSSERSQEQNRQKALEILRGKVYHRKEEERKRVEEGLSVSKTTENEWGSQIRSYVLHPYKVVKDHRTNHEERKVDEVLSGGIQPFIDVLKQSESR